jgi:hypothetical protein
LIKSLDLLSCALTRSWRVARKHLLCVCSDNLIKYMTKYYLIYSVICVLQTGFIKAFSNSVQSFTMGFGHVERVMRTLFVKELYIWPRFHSMVIQSLKQYEVSFFT